MINVCTCYTIPSKATYLELAVTGIQINSVLHGGRRSLCKVLDEVDGAVFVVVELRDYSLSVSK